MERDVTDASASTIWRWLHDDALKPWQQRSWIFVRDPAFRERAGRVLDLYQRRFEGRRYRPDDLVICADEKSQLQALGRRHETVAARPGRPALVGFEHRRRGCCASASTTRQIARPFDWTFTRADLERVLAKITEREPRLALAA